MRVRRAPLALLLLAGGSCTRASSDDANIARGRGLAVVHAAPAAEAAMIDAAARASFDVSPDLALMLYPRRLARSAGWAGGDAVGPELVAALHALGTVRGICEPVRDAPRNTPRCETHVPGYLIRASAPLGAAGDTVQLYLAAERFGAATGPRPEALRLEKVYQLVGSGTRWRVVREARVPTQ